MPSVFPDETISKKPRGTLSGTKALFLKQRYPMGFSQFFFRKKTAQSIIIISFRTAVTMTISIETTNQ